MANQTLQDSIEQLTKSIKDYSGVTEKQTALQEKYNLLMGKKGPGERAASASSAIGNVANVGMMGPGMLLPSLLMKGIQKGFDAIAKKQKGDGIKSEMATLGDHSGEMKGHMKSSVGLLESLLLSQGQTTGTQEDTNLLLKQQHDEGLKQSKVLKWTQLWQQKRQHAEQVGSEKLFDGMKHMSQQNWVGMRMIADELVDIHSTLVGDSPEERVQRGKMASWKRGELLKREADIQDHTDSKLKGESALKHFRPSAIGPGNWKGMVPKYDTRTDINERLEHLRSKSQRGALTGAEAAELKALTDVDKKITRRARSSGQKIADRGEAQYIGDATTLDKVGLSAEQNQINRRRVRMDKVPWTYRNNMIGGNNLGQRMGMGGFGGFGGGEGGGFNYGQFIQPRHPAGAKDPITGRGIGGQFRKWNQDDRMAMSRAGGGGMNCCGDIKAMNKTLNKWYGLWTKRTDNRYENEENRREGKGSMLNNFGMGNKFKMPSFKMPSGGGYDAMDLAGSSVIGGALVKWGKNLWSAAKWAGKRSGYGLALWGLYELYNWYTKELPTGGGGDTISSAPNTSGNVDAGGATKPFKIGPIGKTYKNGEGYQYDTSGFGALGSDQTWTRMIGKSYQKGQGYQYDTSGFGALGSHQTRSVVRTKKQNANPFYRYGVMMGKLNPKQQLALIESFKNWPDDRKDEHPFMKLFGMENMDISGLLDSDIDNDVDSFEMFIDATNALYDKLGGNDARKEEMRKFKALGSDYGDKGGNPFDLDRSNGDWTSDPIEVDVEKSLKELNQGSKLNMKLDPFDNVSFYDTANTIAGYGGWTAKKESLYRAIHRGGPATHRGIPVYYQYPNKKVGPHGGYITEVHDADAKSRGLKLEENTYTGYKTEPKINSYSLERKLPPKPKPVVDPSKVWSTWDEIDKKFKDKEDAEKPIGDQGDLFPSGDGGNKFMGIDKNALFYGAAAASLPFLNQSGMLQSFLKGMNIKNLKGLLKSKMKIPAILMQLLLGKEAGAFEKSGWFSDDKGTPLELFERALGQYYVAMRGGQKGVYKMDVAKFGKRDFMYSKGMKMNRGNMQGYHAAYETNSVTGMNTLYDGGLHPNILHSLIKAGIFPEGTTRGNILEMNVEDVVKKMINPQSSNDPMDDEQLKQLVRNIKLGRNGTNVAGNLIAPITNNISNSVNNNAIIAPDNNPNNKYRPFAFSIDSGSAMYS